MAAASVSLALLAIPLFGNPVSAADSGTATPAVTPAALPSFTECPAVGDDTGCGFQITLNANGTATVSQDMTQGPYDGNDDTLIGIVNNTSVPIPSVNLTSSTDIFGFDGDGICTFHFTGDGYCANAGSPGYQGPDNSYSNISGDKKSGTVDFTTPLAPGASTYFSLESDLSGADFIIPADFTVAKTVTNSGPFYAANPPNPATPIDYQIAVHNFGGTAGNISVTDAIPTNTTLVGTAMCPTGISPATCTVSNVSNTVTWDLFNVPGGATVDLTFSVDPNASSTNYTVSNTALWAGPGCNGDPDGPVPAPEVVSPDVALTPCQAGPVTTPVTAPIPLTITADAITLPYGGPVPAVGFTTSADPVTLATPPTCTTTVTTTDNVGTYTGADTCSGASDPRFLNPITYVAGNATVTPITINITASSGTMTYGGTVPTITPTFGTGFVNGQDSSVLTTQPTCMTTAASTSPVGSYPSSCEGAAATNYVFTYTPGTVTVTPAPLTITASSASVTKGAAVPTITAGYKGFVNGDAASNLTTQPTCSTTYTTSSAVGKYPSSCTGAADPNYTISYVPGTVTVTAAPATAPATTPTTAAPTTTTTAAPATAASTTPAIAFTGALLDQEWIVGVAAVLFGLGLLFMARWRRRTPKHAAGK